MKFDGHVVSPKLIYKIELGFSGRDIGGIDERTNDASRIILDAVLKYNFAGNFVLWFGQAKLPGNRERVVSSQKLQFVDRSLLNAKFNLDRDIGIQLHHHHYIGKALVKEIFSISKGEGRNVTYKNINGYDYTGRFELLPFGQFIKKGDYFQSDLAREPKPKLALGVTYDFNQGAEKSRGQLGDWLDESRNLSTWFVDMVYKHKGYSAMFEYVNRQTEDNPVVEVDGNGVIYQVFYTGTSYNGQMSYLFKNNYEIAGRYTTIIQDPRTERLDVSHYTIGVSKYIIGHSLKAQSDLTYIEVENQQNVWMFRFQIEMAF